MYNVLYSAMSRTHKERSDMDHTVLPMSFTCKLHHACLLFRKRSPDGATTNWGGRHLIGACYSFIDPEGMKGWVGLVGWPIVDGMEERLAGMGLCFRIRKTRIFF